MTHAAPAAHGSAGHGKKKGHGEDPIHKWEELGKKADKLLDTVTVEHSEAYTKAARKVLDKDGRIDYELLKDATKQEEFVDAMVDHYITSAKAALGIKEGGPSKDDPMGIDMLLSAVHGYSRSHLLRTVRELGHRYNIHQHEGVRNKLLENLGKRLYSSAASHLKEGDREGLVKYAKMEDKLDHGKMDLDDAVETAHRHRVGKPLEPHEYESKVYFKKPKANEHGGEAHH